MSLGWPPGQGRMDRKSSRVSPRAAAPQQGTRPALPCALVTVCQECLASLWMETSSTLGRWDPLS